MIKTSVSIETINERIFPLLLLVRSKSPSRPKSPSRKTMAPEPVSYFADASDDDLVAAAEEAEKKASRKTTRSSRSPSLSKSSVVTTSYKHTIEPLIEYNNDVILLNDNSDAEYSPEMLDKVRKPSTPTTKITGDNRRKTLQVGPSISTNYASIKPIEKPISYEDSSSAYRRRYTSYTSPAPAAKNVQEDSLDDEDILKKVETPFLSNFTRRLAELKAAPLPGTDLGHKTPTRSTTSDYLKEYRTSVYGTTGHASDRYRPATPLELEKPASKWSALEKKIRYPLLIFLTLFFAVVVYVFFFSNY